MDQRRANRSFWDMEQACQNRFDHIKHLVHMCTPENFPVIFAGEEDFKFGMGLLGVCAKQFPQVKIITYQLMSNHIHILAIGEDKDLQALFALFKSRLIKYMRRMRRAIDLSAWEIKTFEIDSMSYYRNTIVYINRNGYVVNPDHTPMSYPWGANIYYFNPSAQERYIHEKRPLRVREIRALTHSKKFDSTRGLYTVDGIVSPLCFCDVAEGEAIFVNASHYFVKLSRNVETQGQIAKTISESLFYTDDELYSSAVAISMSEYGSPNITTLPYDKKIQLAKRLHYDYFCGQKQIIRMLKLPENLVESVFR